LTRANSEPMKTQSNPRLLIEYSEKLAPELKKKLGYKNINDVPKLIKIVVNVGFGEATSNPKLLNAVIDDLGVITGQRPVKRRARKSVSNFKLRAGMAIGCKVTIRGKGCMKYLID